MSIRVPLMHPKAYSIGRFMSICVPLMHPKACSIPNFNSNSEAIFLIIFRAW